MRSSKDGSTSAGRGRERQKLSCLSSLHCTLLRLGAAVSGWMGGGCYVCLAITTAASLTCRRLQMCSPSRVDAPPPLLSLPFRRMRHCYSAEVLPDSAACFVFLGAVAQRALHVSRCVARENTLAAYPAPAAPTSTHSPGTEKILIALTLPEEASPIRSLCVSSDVAPPTAFLGWRKGLCLRRCRRSRVVLRAGEPVGVSAANGSSADRLCVRWPPLCYSAPFMPRKGAVSHVEVAFFSAPQTQGKTAGEGSHAHTRARNVTATHSREEPKARG